MHKLIVTLPLLVWATAVSSSELPADPTRPANLKEVKTVVKKAPQRNFAVTYIKVQGKEKVAMVNGQMVEEGSRIEGAYVSAIRADEVVLRVLGSPRVLGLGKSAAFKKQIKEQ